MKKIICIINIIFIIILFSQISFAKYKFNKEIIVGNVDIKNIGVYAKLYDTDSDGIGDTLVLNNLSNFSYDATLINDYGNTNNNEYQATSSDPIWSTDRQNLKKVIVLSNIAPLKTSTWFYEANSLTEIEGTTNIDTSKVEDMNNMFLRCYSLTSLDLSSFNTANVTNMELMFTACSKLKKIYVSENFVVDQVEESANMFYGCKALIGSKASYQNTFFVDKTYANYNGGYFTLKE